MRARFFRLPTIALLAAVVSVPLMVLALAGIVVVIAAIIPIHSGGGPRQFYANGCGFEIQFNGTTLDDKETPSTLDDEYTWSYTVTDLNGTGCALSHWVLELCKSDPEGSGAFSAYIDGEPEPSDLVDLDPGFTGRTGVKWNELSENGDFETGTFTVTLDENFALDPNTPVGFKVGTGTPTGTITGDIEGPSCVAPTPTPTPTPPPECPGFPPGETHDVELQLCLDDIRLDSDQDGTLDFSSGPVCFTGLAEIWRSDAYLSDGHCTIDKEMKSLYLTGTVGPWPVWLAAGTDQGLGDPSTGKIVSISQVPGEEFPAVNDWDVHFKIGGLPTGELQNCDLDQDSVPDAATLVAQISTIPPYDTIHEGGVDLGDELPCCDQGGIVRAEGEDAEGELSLAVGGVVETLDGSAEPDSSLDSSSGSGFNYTALGGALAAVAVAVAAGAWFARRRWAR